MNQMPRRVDKPWGYELIWAEAPAYVGKILHIDAGESLSLQYHEIKDETIHMLKGSIRFQSGTSASDLEEVTLGPGESVRIAPYTIHRMEALSECDILEVSTPHLDDLVRLEDRYGRGGDD